MSFAEYVYTTILKPPLLKAAANWVILRLLPEKLRVEEAVIVLNPDDPVVSGALTFGVYEKPERHFLRRILRPGQTVLDIGANVGLYSAMAAVRVGNEGKVVAFEPDPVSLAFLEKTIATNRLRNVEVIAAAASDEPGNLRLYFSPGNRGDNRLYQHRQDQDSVLVDTVRVDNQLEVMNINEVDVIKIDVQGFEGHVIDGMHHILKNSRRLVMLTEFWPQGLHQAGTDPLEFLERLQGFGLSVYELGKRGDCVPVADFAELISRFSGRAYTNLVLLASEAVIDD